MKGDNPSMRCYLQKVIRSITSVVAERLPVIGPAFEVANRCLAMTEKEKKESELQKRIDRIENHIGENRAYQEEIFEVQFVEIVVHQYLEKCDMQNLKEYWCDAGFDTSTDFDVDFVFQIKHNNKEKVIVLQFIEPIDIESAQQQAREAASAIRNFFEFYEADQPERFRNKIMSWRCTVS